MTLIAHWPLDGDAKDVSGNRDGTIGSGASWSASGKIGQGLNSTRVANSHVLVPHDNEISERIFGPDSDNFSICFWYYPRTMPSYGAIVQKSTGGSWSNSTTGFWAFGGSTLGFIVASNLGGNPSNSYVRIDKILTLNQWHFCVGTMEDKIIKMYVDGEYIGSGDTSNLVGKTSNTSEIILGGARHTTYADGLDSVTNDIRIFDHVLTDFEMQEIARAKILHYTFNNSESEPTTNICNMTGVRYNGTPIGDDSFELVNDDEFKINSAYWNDSGAYIDVQIPCEASTEYTMSLEYFIHPESAGLLRFDPNGAWNSSDSASIIGLWTKREWTFTTD